MVDLLTDFNQGYAFNHIFKDKGFFSNRHQDSALYVKDQVCLKKVTTL